jgi:hypothetical protein
MRNSFSGVIKFKQFFVPSPAIRGISQLNSRQFETKKFGITFFYILKLEKILNSSKWHTPLGAKGSNINGDLICAQLMQKAIRVDGKYIFIKEQRRKTLNCNSKFK